MSRQTCTLLIVLHLQIRSEGGVGWCGMVWDGVWCVVCGVWCLVCGVWCVVCGVWCVVCRVSCVVCRVSCAYLSSTLK